MRPDTIVSVAPIVVEDRGLEDRVEDLAGEEFVANLAVKALQKGVLPGAARLNRLRLVWRRREVTPVSGLVPRM